MVSVARTKVEGHISISDALQRLGNVRFGRLDMESGDVMAGYGIRRC